MISDIPTGGSVYNTRFALLNRTEIPVLRILNSHGTIYWYEIYIKNAHTTAFTPLYKPHKPIPFTRISCRTL